MSVMRKANDLAKVRDDIAYRANDIKNSIFDVLQGMADLEGEIKRILPANKGIFPAIRHPEVLRAGIDYWGEKKVAINAWWELVPTMNAVNKGNNSDWSNDEKFRAMRKIVAEGVASAYIALAQLVEIYDITHDVQEVIDRQIDCLAQDLEEAK